MNRATLLVLATAIAGCTDLSQRWELDHARVLAVRAAQPGLAADTSTAIDGLVVDANGAPRVVTPSAITAVEPPPLLGGLTIAGATVTAGNADAIAAARAAAGLAADQPLVVTLGLAFDVDGQRLVATKRVRLGTAADNPPSVTMVVDGTAVDGTATVPASGVLALSLTGFDPEADLEFDWLTSTGALTGSETATATLELADDDPRTGHVVALVRSEDGGVTWVTTALTAP